MRRVLRSEKNDGAAPHIDMFNGLKNGGFGGGDDRSKIAAMGSEGVVF